MIRLPARQSARLRTRLSLCLALVAAPALAEAPVVEGTTLRPAGDGWAISVTLSHPDTGWDHYADGWEVLDADGRRLGLRELLHPHVSEQPFTRALSGLVLPPGATGIAIRPRCNVTGWGAATPVDVTPD